MKEVLAGVVFIFVVGGFWLSVAICSWPKSREVTAEQTPKLYCQYSAGYGKRVWEYEDIGNGDIITDADDVFNLSVCEEWSEYEKSSN